MFRSGGQFQVICGDELIFEAIARSGFAAGYWPGMLFGREAVITCRSFRSECAVCLNQDQRLRPVAVPSHTVFRQPDKERAGTIENAIRLISKARYPSTQLSRTVFAIAKVPAACYISGMQGAHF
jgi:hypothetical protein